MREKKISASGEAKFPILNVTPVEGASKLVPVESNPECSLG
jgi:hypothetical protein